jgi:hypothetical protein
VYEYRQLRAKEKAMTKTHFALVIAVVGTVFSAASNTSRAAPIAPLYTVAPHDNGTVTPVSWHSARGAKRSLYGRLGGFQSMLPLLAGRQGAGGLGGSGAMNAIAPMLGGLAGSGDMSAIAPMLGGLGGSGDMSAIAPMLGGLGGSGDMSAIAPMLGGLAGSGNMNAIAPMLGGLAGPGGAGAIQSQLAGRGIAASPRGQRLRIYGNSQTVAGGGQSFGGLGAGHGNDYSRMMQGLGGAGGIDVARMIGMARSMGLGSLGGL